ncbi:MAG TPA: ABC transporter C-terminal domain-containing protein, partial [Candidatus Elarobacter sp.]|nr:ABC transporter C-terminal domain-containing protein [Candidatus Elarobacter sp.]
GDYETWERRQHEPPAAPPPGAPARTASHAPQDPGARKTADRRAAHEAKLDAGRRKRAVADAESRVAQLDRERAALEAEFTVHGTYDEPQRVVELQHALERNRAESEDAMAAWERAVEAAG